MNTQEIDWSQYPPGLDENKKETIRKMLSGDTSSPFDDVMEVIRFLNSHALEQENADTEGEGDF